MVLFTTATAYTVPAKSRTKAAVKKVSLSAPSGSIRTVYVAKGKKVSLTTKVSVKPYTKRNAGVTYKSANRKIATVSKKGVVKGRKRGKTKITVISKINPKKRKTIKVKVVKPVKSMKFDRNSITLTEGRAQKLTLSIKAPKGAYTKYKVKSTDPGVAVLCGEKQCTVKSYKPGKATVTAYALDGSGKKATCVVTVLPKKSKGEKETGGSTTDNASDNETSSKTGENSSTHTGTEPGTTHTAVNPETTQSVTERETPGAANSDGTYRIDNGDGTADIVLSDGSPAGTGTLSGTIDTGGKSLPSGNWEVDLVDSSGSLVCTVNVTGRTAFSFNGLKEEQYTAVLYCGNKKRSEQVAEGNQVTFTIDAGSDGTYGIDTGDGCGNIYLKGGYSEAYYDYLNVYLKTAGEDISECVCYAYLYNSSGERLCSVHVMDDFFYFSFNKSIEDNYTIELYCDGKLIGAENSSGEKITFSVFDYGCIKGNIEYRDGSVPEAGHTVMLTDAESGAVTASVKTGNDGKYEFRKISAGDYYIKVLDPQGKEVTSYTCAAQTGLMPLHYGATVPATSVQHLEAGEVIDHTRCAMDATDGWTIIAPTIIKRVDGTDEQQGNIIRGYRREQGNKKPSSTVILYQVLDDGTYEEIARTETDDDGYFIFTNVPKGKYQVSAGTATYKNEVPVMRDYSWYPLWYFSLGSW